jgi:hypothetical protein
MLRIGARGTLDKLGLSASPYAGAVVLNGSTVWSGTWPWAHGSPYGGPFGNFQVLSVNVTGRVQGRNRVTPVNTSAAGGPDGRNAAGLLHALTFRQNPFDYGVYPGSAAPFAVGVPTPTGPRPSWRGWSNPSPGGRGRRPSIGRCSGR